jgi:Transglycosylase SLT domain
VSGRATRAGLAGAGATALCMLVLSSHANAQAPSAPASTTTPSSQTSPTTTTQAAVPTPTAPATPQSSTPPPPLVINQRPQAPSSPSVAVPKHAKSHRPPKRSLQARPPKRPPALALIGAPLPGSVSIALASASATFASLRWFRIPLFLLPIYQAASIDYGVPWQVLAAINEIETDYGRNQSVSSAGAIGWMQFVPASWQQFGVDATGTGLADPYNPADAIFAAARYLRAAGAQSDLRRAIFAYNHAGWYVDSAMLRAKLIGTFPDSVIAALTGLAQGRPPIAAPTTYHVDVHGRAGAKRAPAIYDLLTPRAAPVLASQPGHVVALGHSRARGNFLDLRDVYGNVYSYSDLTSLARRYRTPTLLVSASTPSALAQWVFPQPTTTGAQLRLYAHPALATAALLADRRSNSGTHALASRASAPSGASGRQRWSPLIRGAALPAGVEIGRVSPPAPLFPARLRFQIKPVGDTGPIDPRPIIAGWRLLARTLRALPITAAPAQALDPSIANVLLLPKLALQRRVLADHAIRIYRCGRGDVRAGRIDVRILALLAYLAKSGLRPTVSALACGRHHGSMIGSEHTAGQAVDISAINSLAIRGHQGPASIVDLAINRLLMLGSPLAPDQIISLHSYPGAASTIGLPDHADRIEIGFLPTRAAAASHVRLAPSQPQSAIASSITGTLNAHDWSALITRIAAAGEPVVEARPSSSALRVVAAQTPLARASGRP